MERVYLPHEKCVGLDMPDITYHATEGRGYVEVDNPAHLKALRDNTGLQVGERHTFSRAAALECVVCGFRQFAALASSLCTRCGGAYSRG